MREDSILGVYDKEATILETDQQHFFQNNAFLSKKKKSFGLLLYKLFPCEK